jgi:hypothetical protein
MGGPTKEQLDLLEQKVKFVLRPLITSITTSGMTKERRVELDGLLLDISDLRENTEERIDTEGSTEDRMRLAGLVDYLYSLIKSLDIEVNLPERRQHPRDDVSQMEQAAETIEKPKEVRVMNISLGGMRLRSPSTMKIGSVVRTRLASSRHGPIPLRGEVIWVQEDEEEGSYIIGVHFLPMDQDVVKALRGYLGERHDRGETPT